MFVDCLLCDREYAVSASRSISSIFVAIQSCELLWVFRKLYKDGIVGASGSCINLRIDDMWFKWLSSARTVTVAFIILLRCGAAVYILVLQATASGWCDIFLATSGLFLAFLSPYLLSAADQMVFFVLVGTGLSQICDQPAAREAVAWFVAVQVSIAYCANGFFKMSGRSWRSGDALLGIAKTEVFGSSVLSGVLSKGKIVGKIACISVIIWECLFPVAIVTYPVGTFVFVGVGVVFHLTVALLMRLNGFLFAFVSSYPFVVYCSCQFYRFGLEGVLGVLQLDIFP